MKYAIRALIEAEMAMGPARTFSERLENTLISFIQARASLLWEEGDLAGNAARRNLVVNLTQTTNPVIVAPTWDDDGGNAA